MSDRSKVLIIYTGGTIGMMTDPRTGALRPMDLAHLEEHVPELVRMNVKLDAVSFERPIDSSDMRPADQVRIAQLIGQYYADHDGFVILHGSDTMAYTASALSFLLEGLAKPVVLTGSQLPIGTIRTDGKENLLTAIEIAAPGSSGFNRTRAARSRPVRTTSDWLSRPKVPSGPRVSAMAFTVDQPNSANSLIAGCSTN